ncbi:hypothetical protein ABK040_015172 [Willaertia magna]
MSIPKDNTTYNTMSTDAILPSENNYINESNSPIVENTIINNSDRKTSQPKRICGFIRTDRYLGIIELQPGVSWVNLTTFYFLVGVIISIFVFINAMANFVFETYLRGEVAKSSQGRLTGDLSFYNELTIIVFGAIWGVLTDILRGRKFVYIIGFFFMAAGLTLYTFATEVWQLILIRILFAIGAASTSHMLTAILGDYVVNNDRGKASGILGIVSGLGAVIAALLFLRIPKWLVSAGISNSQAGFATFLMMAFLSVISGCLVMIFLKGKIFPICENRRNRSSNNEDNESENSDDLQTSSSNPIIKGFTRLFKIIKDGLFIAPFRRPTLILAYLSSVVARGDATLITNFITLWVAQQVRLNGGSTSDGTAKGGEISGVCQVFGLLAAPFIGFFADIKLRRRVTNSDSTQSSTMLLSGNTRRVARTITMSIVSLISGAGYLVLSLFNDVTSASVYAPIFLIGVGEIGVIIVSQVLVTQETPEPIRGSVSGVFTMMGGLGILIATKVGGILFDDWKPSGPFIFYAILNFILCGISILFAILTYIGRNTKAFKDLVEESSTGDEVAKEEETVAIA